MRRQLELTAQEVSRLQGGISAQQANGIGAASGERGAGAVATKRPMASGCDSPQERRNELKHALSGGSITKEKPPSTRRSLRAITAAGEEAELESNQQSRIAEVALGPRDFAERRLAAAAEQAAAAAVALEQARVAAEAANNQKDILEAELAAVANAEAEKGAMASVSTTALLRQFAGFSATKIAERERAAKANAARAASEGDAEVDSANAAESANGAPASGVEFAEALIQRSLTRYSHGLDSEAPQLMGRAQKRSPRTDTVSI